MIEGTYNRSDGVSEGQFKQVIDIELPRLKGMSLSAKSLPLALTILAAACQQLNINPLITLIVVGKRHHIRFFPMDPSQADKSGNCRAGTVIDSDITSPVELDFYLQSHAGLLGTSRPAHYNVLYDDNKFTTDALQALSFALCHVYARSTRSVSIPAPVYCECFHPRAHALTLTADCFQMRTSYAVARGTTTRQMRRSTSATMLRPSWGRMPAASYNFSERPSSRCIGICST